jgi:DNA-binding XRE family transcriptional regulator
MIFKFEENYKSQNNMIFIVFFKKIIYFCTKNHTIMLVKQVGEQLRIRRKELKITQPHLAELAEISTNTLYKLERGQGNPSLNVLCKLADVLGMNITFEIKK